MFVSRRGRDAPPLLLEAARRLAPLDARMARATYLQAIASAMSAGRLGSGADVREVAEAARASTSTPAAPTAADQLLDALVTRFTEGYAASVAPLSRALHAIGECDGDGEERHWLWLACRLAQDLWDDELWYALATRGVRVARETGALSLLPVMANHLAAFHIHAGAFASAAALIEEVDAIAKATGLPPLRYSEIWLAAARGEQAQDLFDRGWQSLMTRGEGQGIGMFWRLTAMRHNSRGHYAEALRDAQQAVEHEDVMSYGWALVELIEAGVRDGRPDAAARRARTPDRTHAGVRHRLGARDRSALSRAAERRRAPLPGVDRAARAQPGGDRARAQPAPVRRVAPAREPAHRRARGPARRPRELQPQRSGCVRRARPARVDRDR